MGHEDVVNCHLATLNHHAGSDVTLHQCLRNTFKMPQTVLFHGLLHPDPELRVKESSDEAAYWAGAGAQEII